MRLLCLLDFVSLHVLQFPLTYFIELHILFGWTVTFFVAFVDRTVGYTGYFAFTSVRIVMQQTFYFLSHGSAACTYV